MGDAFLRRLGLTAKEARAYRELLRTRGLDARQLSDRMSDTYPAIFRTLESLETKGWIVHTGGRPRRFHARPPRDVAGDLRRSAMESIEEATAWLAALETLGPDPEPRVCKGLSASLAALESLARDARGDVFCVSPGPLDIELLQMVLRQLSRAPGSVEWYLNVANRDDIAALRPIHGPNVRALAVIPRSRETATRLEHLFAFGSDTNMVTINAWYRDDRLDREGTHAICLADTDVVRVQLRALVMSTRAFSERPVPVP